MADELAVWLYGERVATIDRGRRGHPQLTYADEALVRYDLGTPLLSLALPVGTERYTQGVARPFFDGLLPEGEPRKSIRWGMSPSRATEIVGHLLERAPGAIATAREETEGVPEDLVATIEHWLAQLRVAVQGNCGTP